MTRADLVQEKGIIMGKPVADIDFTMVKRLFEINELIFRIDQPERTLPNEMKSFRDAELEAEQQWPNSQHYKISEIFRSYFLTLLIFRFEQKSTY